MTPQDLARAAEIRHPLRPCRQSVIDVSGATGISVAEIMGRSQTRHIAQARQLAYFVAHEAGASCAQIGRFFDRDSSTVSQGIRAEASRRVAQ